MPSALVNPVVNHTVRGLCVRQYSGHPKGCPNFGKKTRCPPQAPHVGEVFDLSQPVYAIWNVFDFGGHVARMKDKHPQWSDRQAACCLYWQGGARKALRRILLAFLREHPGMTAVQTPEAMGVDITATMGQIGEVLEWPPKTVTYQIALVGYRAKAVKEKS